MRFGPAKSLFLVAVLTRSWISAARECKDAQEECAVWASHGECVNNPNFMLMQCRESCNNCDIDIDNPLISHDPRDYPDTGSDLGTPQQLTLPDGTREQDIQWLLQKARNYILNILNDEDAVLCKNKDKNCAWWALKGECENNPDYMRDMCAPVCSSCEGLAES